MHVGYYFGALFSFLVWKLGTLDILRVSGLMHIRYYFTLLLPIALSSEFPVDFYYRVQVHYGTISIDALTKHPGGSTFAGEIATFPFHHPKSSR